MTGGRVTADETRSRQKGNVRNSGVIGNRSMLEIVQRAAPAVIQRTVTVGTGGGKKTYDGTGEEHVKKELGLYLPRTKYKKRQAEMLTELSKWLADEAPHSAKTYEDLAANLFEAVLPAPSQTVCDASVPVYEGDFPSIWGIKETMIYEEWLKKIHLKEKCISELKAMEGGKYGEKLKELSDARLKDLKGYLEFLDEILKEGDSQELKISEDIQKADYMNLADDLGRAFALRDKAPMDFEYAGTKYSIRMGGDYVCGSGLGSLKNYYDICKDAIRSIVAKQECGEIERRDPEEVLADHVASMLLDTAFESSVPAVRDLCAVISSAETNRSAHNLMAAAASAANFRFLRNGKETFFDYMERTNAFWKKGGAELSRQADGSEIRLLSDIKCHGMDLEALYRRLLNVRRAKMKIVAV